MKKSLKKFFVDYSETKKACNRFHKEHWKGEIVFVGVLWTIEFAAIAIPMKIKQKKDEQRLNELCKEQDETKDEV